MIKLLDPEEGAYSHVYIQISGPDLHRDKIIIFFRDRMHCSENKLETFVNFEGDGKKSPFL